MAERKPIRTDADIRNAKPEDRPYRRAAGRGLYLEVRPATDANPQGAKLWRYRYRLPNAEGVRLENMYAVGAYGRAGPDHGQFTLAEAEAERGRLRELVKRGIHPIQARREHKAEEITKAANTFQAVAERWLESKRHALSDHYIKQIERAFAECLFPAIGKRPISAIDHADISNIVERRAVASPSVALLIQQWTGAIFRFAIKKKLGVTHDPTYVLRGDVQRPPVQSKKPLLRGDFPAFAAALEEFGGNRTTKIALALLLHTFVRPGELCGATWAEFDLDGGVWKIGAKRMKAGREHWVPLSSQSVALLRELRTLTGGQQWLFPNARDPRKHMTTKALNKALERMGYSGRFSAHGFRATASTALNGLGFRHDAIEAQLAHKERNATRASYNTATYWNERERMMRAWADIVGLWTAGKDVEPVNVVEIRRKEAVAA